MAEGRVEIPGSVPEHGNETRVFAAFPPDRQITATIVVRRRRDAPEVGEQLLAGDFQAVSRENSAEIIGADPADLQAVENFAAAYNLAVSRTDASSRTVKLTGSATSFESAFDVRLGQFGDTRSYSGPLSVPTALGGVIVAVLGLDTRPIARSAH